MKIKMYELYYSAIQYPTLFDIILYKLCKLNDTKILKDKLSGFIYFLEKLKFGTKHNEKLIHVLECDSDIYVRTVNNKENLIGNIYRTIPFTDYLLVLEDGKKLLGADNHMVYADINKNQDWTFIAELIPGDFVYTADGWRKVINVKKYKHKEFMYDIELI